MKAYKVCASQHDTNIDTQPIQHTLQQTLKYPIHKAIE